ncbi:MAG: hypothetical protein QHJ81_11920 [Anaerolineae bacterium]|nr:hypothetical protein [Anaerolineae bacterium]
MSQESIRLSIEQQARRAIIQHAFLRWESAVIVAGTLLLSFFSHPFPWWPWWGWPLLGVIAEALIVYTSLTDAETAARVVAELFREQFDPRQVQDRKLRDRLSQALEYRERIDRAVRQQRESVLRQHLADMAAGIDDWISQMFRLARRLDTYHADTVIQRDLKAVPKEIESLQARLRLETDPAVRGQMEATLESKRTQWRSLQKLDDTMERAELQTEHSLSALGTVYSQLLLIGASEVDSGRAQRLREDIRQQVMSLQDMVDSINEVYDYRVEGVRLK